MGGTFDDAEKGVKQAKSTVASLKRQISSAQKAAKQSQKLLTQVQGSAQSFSSSLAGAFDNGSVQLSGIGVSVNNAAGDALSAFNTAQGSIDDITNALQKPIDGAATLSSDLKDAMNKAGIGRDTAIGKQIWQQIDALDKTVNTQQASSTPSTRTRHSSSAPARARPPAFRTPPAPPPAAASAYSTAHARRSPEPSPRT